MITQAEQERRDAGGTMGAGEPSPALPDLVVGRADAPARPERGGVLGGRRRRLLRVLVPVLLLGAAAVVGGERTRDMLGWSDTVPAVRKGIGERVPGVEVPADMPVVGLGRILPAGDVVRVAAPGGIGEARVERLLVSEGDVVEQGARFAVLDTEARLKAALEQAEAEVAQRRAALERARLTVGTERARRAAAVARARAGLEAARADLDRARALSSGRVVAEAALEQRELAYRQAEADLAEARAVERRYAGALDEQADIALARQDLAVAEAAADRAAAELDQAYVTAPIEGRILEILARPGERIGSGALLDMGATDRMMAKAEIYESDVGRLAAGQRAVVTATPFSEPLTGTVARIGLQVRRQAVVDATPAANTDARIVEAWIRLDPASSERVADLTGLQVTVRVTP